VAAYFALFGGEYSLFELRHLRREAIAERVRLDSIKAQVRLLELRRDSLLDDSATIERIARERYGMIRSGERLYRFASVPDSLRRDSIRADSLRKDSLRKR
jgi:cell division protein FtsB